MPITSSGPIAFHFLEEEDGLPTAPPASFLVVSVLWTGGMTRPYELLRILIIFALAPGGPPW